MKYKVGDVVSFNWNDSLFFKVEAIFNYIRYGESKATHTGIITRVEGDKIYIAEAVNTFKEHEYDKWWLDWKAEEKRLIVSRPTQDLKGIYKAFKKYEGLKYDYLSIILLIFKLSINSTKLLFCSEAVARILYDCGLDIASELGKDYEKITPMDLYLSKQLTKLGEANK